MTTSAPRRSNSEATKSAAKKTVQSVAVQPRQKSAPGQGTERRVHPRARAEMQITIGAADRRYPARVRDISKSGVCFHSPRPVPEMTLLHVELEIPGPLAKTVRAGGAVVRNAKLPTGEYEIAVFFMAITEMDRDAIGAFVNERLAAN